MSIFSHFEISKVIDLIHDSRILIRMVDVVCTCTCNSVLLLEADMLILGILLFFPSVGKKTFQQ